MNVCGNDGDERVAVLATLLVPESDGVPNLVDRRTDGTARSQGHGLLAPLSTDARLADGRRTGLEGDVVRVTGLARSKTEGCLLLPVSDGGFDPIAHGGFGDIGDDAAGQRNSAPVTPTPRPSFADPQANLVRGPEARCHLRRRP